MSEPSPPMLAALEAAERARGLTSPNPWVGAALVRDGTIIAAGATEPAPGRHAERVALELAGDAARGATLYCTLEPCAPFEGKRTPACADGIIESGVANVVIAIEDADPRVGGEGVRRLRDAGIAVAVGDGSELARRQLRPYLKHRETGVPYVVAKFAATLDGRIATASGESRWITGEEARARVHEERLRSDAILVGSGTVVADDPSLTARPGGAVAERQPLRIVLDSRGRTPSSAVLLSQPGKTLFVTTAAAPDSWRRDLTGAGAEVLVVEASAAGVQLNQVLPALARRGILRLWVEGGPTVLGSLFDEGLVDEVWAFIAPMVIGGAAPGAVAGEGVARLSDATRLRDVRVEAVGPDVLVRGWCGGWEPTPSA